MAGCTDFDPVPSANKLTVEQCDRDVAADFLESWEPGPEMTDYSAAAIREWAKGKTWLNHHDCSICGQMVGYVIDGELVYFRSACGCSWSQDHPSSFDDIAQWLAMQSSDEMRDLILQGFRCINDKLQPLDTSTLGQILCDPNAEAARAKIVRDALEAMGMRPECTIDEHWAFNKLARIASNETLARLGRMLK